MHGRRKKIHQVGVCECVFQLLDGLHALLAADFLNGFVVDCRQNRERVLPVVAQQQRNEFADHHRGLLDVVHAAFAQIGDFLEGLRRLLVKADPLKRFCDFAEADRQLFAVHFRKFHLLTSKKKSAEGKAHGVLLLRRFVEEVDRARRVFVVLHGVLVCVELDRECTFALVAESQRHTRVVQRVVKRDGDKSLGRVAEPDEILNIVAVFDVGSQFDCGLFSGRERLILGLLSRAKRKREVIRRDLHKRRGQLDIPGINNRAALELIPLAVRFDAAHGWRCGKCAAASRRTQRLCAVLNGGEKCFFERAVFGIGAQVKIFEKSARVELQPLKRLRSDSRYRFAHLFHLD
nr:MAG TPA: hypothetical protein [Caudoviricetes sp.]